MKPRSPRSPRKARLVATVAALAAIALAAAAPVALANPPGPAKLPRAIADSLRADIEKGRAETQEWLAGGATSYLATILRKDFEDRATLVVGSAPDADVRLAEDFVKPHHLGMTVAGDSFRVESEDPYATFTTGGRDTSQATLPPGSIKIGRFGVRLSHQRFPALIVFDPQSPRFQHVPTMRWFPVDARWRFDVALTPNPNPDTTIIESTRGNRRRAVNVGWFEFKARGKRCRLTATRLLEPGVGESDFSIFFRDATTGAESYGVGRYLEPEKLPDGRYRLDFNNAYNPACAYSEHYNCPIPPKENRLPMAVRAGELDPHVMEH